MKDNLMKLIPWILLGALVIYTFFIRSDELNKAISELKIARSQVDSATAKINYSLTSLNLIKDSLVSFKSNSDLLYGEFKGTVEQFRRDIQPMKKKIDDLRITLNARLVKENKDNKPIEIINK